jgi:hypothetical protein
MDSAPPPPSGRRDNGLASAQWGALVDLDPRLSEALLDRLAAVGVPAYVEPASGAVDTVSRAVALPKRPLDRLWVDPSRADEARAVVGAEVADLTALLAEEDPTANAHGLVQPVPRTAAAKVLHPPPLPERPVASDTDDAFAQIVAGWEQQHDAPVAPWPVSEDVDENARPTDEPRRLRRRSDPAEPDDALPAWLEPDALDDDGHYVPPPPPPVPKVRRHTVGALTCLTIGLILVFAPNLIGQIQSVGLGIVGIALMVGGAGTLVWHMRDAPPTDSGSDDGAVV